MSLLGALNTSEDIQEAGDSAGSKFAPVESGLYAATIEQAYVKIADSEAMALVIECEVTNGSIVSQTFWMTSGKAKGKKNYFIDKAGAKQYLPGFNQANALALLTTGKPINKLDTESKMIDMYDYSVKSQVPTKVDMVMELVGKSVKLGIVKQIVNKRAKDPVTGNYVATAATREENEINKIFRASDNMTVTEIKAKAETAAFYAKWHAKFAGKTLDKTVDAAKTIAAPTVDTPAQSTLFA